MREEPPRQFPRYLRPIVLVAVVGSALYFSPRIPRERTLEWDVAAAPGLTELALRIDDADGDTLSETRLRATPNAGRLRQTWKAADGTYRAFVTCTTETGELRSEHRLQLDRATDHVRVAVCR